MGGVPMLTPATRTATMRFSSARCVQLLSGRLRGLINSLCATVKRPYCQYGCNRITPTASGVNSRSRGDGIRFHPYRSELQPLARVNERHRRTPSIPCACVVATLAKPLTGQATIVNMHHRPGAHSLALSARLRKGGLLGSFGGHQALRHCACKQATSSMRESPVCAHHVHSMRSRGHFRRCFFGELLRGWNGKPYTG